MKTYLPLNISLYIFTFINRFLSLNEKSFKMNLEQYLHERVSKKRTPQTGKKLFCTASQTSNILNSLMFIPHRGALNLSIEFLHINIKIYHKLF